MKDYLLTILIVFIFFACNSAKERTKCNDLFINDVDTSTVHSQIIGEWYYDYSYNQDTCQQLRNSTKLPSKLFFYRCDDSVLLRNSNYELYKLRGKNKFFNLCCRSYVEDIQAEVFYPLIDYSSKSSIRVLNYGQNKKYRYYIEYLEEDKLVMRNEKIYVLRGKKIYNVRHVYKRL